jgi:2-phospho-L-lactate guanylyltransferase
MTAAPAAPAACWALVPLKRLVSAKQRLETALPAAERADLVGWMFAKVLDVLRRTEGLAGIAVVTPERALVPDDVLWIADPGGGLNAALSAASVRLEAVGAQAVLTVPADVPLATPGEIAAVLAAAASHPVVVVPDHWRRGTVALCLSPPSLFAPCYGETSFADHVAAARRAGVEPRLCDLPGLAFDIDVPEDVTELRRRTAWRGSWSPAAIAAQGSRGKTGSTDSQS